MLKNEYQRLRSNIQNSEIFRLKDRMALAAGKRLIESIDALYPTMISALGYNNNQITLIKNCINKLMYDPNCIFTLEELPFDHWQGWISHRLNGIVSALSVSDKNYFSFYANVLDDSHPTSFIRPEIFPHMTIVANDRKDPITVGSFVKNITPTSIEETAIYDQFAADIVIRYISSGIGVSYRHYMVKEDFDLFIRHQDYTG